jgi:hypothetical protein
MNVEIGNEAACSFFSGNTLNQVFFAMHSRGKKQVVVAHTLCGIKPSKTVRQVVHALRDKIVQNYAPR